VSRIAPSCHYEKLTDFARVIGHEGVTQAYAVSRWLTRPTPGRPRRNPGCLGLAWEPCTCRTGDGLRLDGWVVTPSRPRATVALFHGLRGSREEMLPLVALLAGAGFRCVAFDHRAHGESEGRRTSFGFHEARDVLAVLDWVEACWPRQAYAVLGRCLGAAAVCFAGLLRHRPAAVILESLSACPEPVVLRPRSPGAFGACVRWMTGQRLGVRLADIAPVRYLAGLAPTPVLLATGAHDDRASAGDVQRLLAFLERRLSSAARAAA
jgi:pimeloyl-ACP methyl ester carboxylesterase